jgi:hypothetical protein
MATTKEVVRPVTGALGLRKSQLLFCVAAFISFVASVSLWFGGYKEEGVFVGIWVPSILSLGTLLLAGKPGLR